MAFPQPLIIPPLSGTHELTFILLHGRGSHGHLFGPALLDSPIAPRTTSTASPQDILCLATAFPTARFVFPTAPRRRAALYKRMLTRQWFDSWDLQPPATEKEELQIDGLSETVPYVHRLWSDEIALVPGGARNLIVGGLSQGCAASLISLLLWHGPPVGAFVGMCGWLPFAERLKQHMRNHSPREDIPNSSDDPWDPFEREHTDQEGEAVVPPSVPALEWLKEELLMDYHHHHHQHSSGSFTDTPIFLGHGDKDEKVNIALGQTAVQVLTALGADAHFESYRDLIHWYSPELLRHVVEFLSPYVTRPRQSESAA